jgi:hypothetical protein
MCPVVGVRCEEKEAVNAWLILTSRPHRPGMYWQLKHGEVSHTRASHDERIGGERTCGLPGPHESTGDLRPQTFEFRKEWRDITT